MATNIKAKPPSSLEVKLAKQRNAVNRSESVKSGMADLVWRENVSYQPLWNEIKILDREEHQRKNQRIHQAIKTFPVGHINKYDSH